MDLFYRNKCTPIFVRPSRRGQSKQQESYMMKRFRKTGVICRLLGCLFIDGFWDRTLRKARTRAISIYNISSAAWILLASIVTTLFISDLFLFSDLAHSFTKSLLFIVNSILSVRIGLHFICMMLGSSSLLQFLRDSHAYEMSTSFVPITDSASRRLRRCSQLRKIVAFFLLGTVYGFAVRNEAANAGQGYDERYRFVIKAATVVTSFVMLFYDSLVYIILSCCTHVLVDYMRAQVATLDIYYKDNQVRFGMQSSRQVDEVRLAVSRIKILKKSINKMWKPALIVWPSCVIIALCITIYAISAGNFGHPDIWLAISYSAYASVSFTDLAILSEALREEARKLKDAALRLAMKGTGETYRQHVRYLHDTIDPDTMFLSGAGFYLLSKSLLVTMAGSIMTYAVILVQTGDTLAKQVDVASLVRTAV